MKEIAGNGDGGTVLQTTKTIYNGDRTTVIPPVGGTATTTLADARGHTTELRQLHARDADSAYDKTTYNYDVRDHLTKVTDAAGNIWSYSYDQLGRQIRSDDPAKGETSSTYDDRGQLITTTDARNTSWLTSMTALAAGLNSTRPRPRPTAREVGLRHHHWRQGAACRIHPLRQGQAYTSKVTAYDRLYRPVRTAVVIPDSEGALAGTYQLALLTSPPA